MPCEAIDRSLSKRWDSAGGTRYRMVMLLQGMNTQFQSAPKFERRFACAGSL